MLSRFSDVQLSATLWTVACQALLSIGFSRQEYWSGLAFPSLGDLPDPGIKPGSSELLANSLPLSHQGSPYVDIGAIKEKGILLIPGPLNVWIPIT